MIVKVDGQEFDLQLHDKDRGGIPRITIEILGGGYHIRSYCGWYNLIEMDYVAQWNWYPHLIRNPTENMSPKLFAACKKMAANLAFA